MGMSIEEAIEFKKYGYHTPLSSFENIDDMNAQISKCAEYDRLALETMRKYQKIEEIVKRYERPNKEETDNFYWDIIGVVEDGNDD